MSQILQKCQKCQRIFNFPIDIGAGSTITLKGNIVQCPFCGSFENAPEGTFKGTIEGIVEILKNSPDKLQTAKNLLDEFDKNTYKNNLNKISSKSNFLKFKKWLPDSPQKLAVYITILKIIIDTLIKNPTIQIEYNNIINIYNQTIINRTK